MTGADNAKSGTVAKSQPSQILDRDHWDNPLEGLDIFAGAATLMEVTVSPASERGLKDRRHERRRRPLPLVFWGCRLFVFLGIDRRSVNSGGRSSDPFEGMKRRGPHVDALHALTGGLSSPSAGRRSQSNNDFIRATKPGVSEVAPLAFRLCSSCWPRHDASTARSKVEAPA